MEEKQKPKICEYCKNGLGPFIIFSNELIQGKKAGMLIYGCTNEKSPHHLTLVMSGCNCIEWTERPEPGKIVVPNLRISKEQMEDIKKE